MSVHEFPSDNDAGTQARARRDEVEGLMDLGISMEFIESYKSALGPLERRGLELLYANDKAGAVQLIENEIDRQAGDSLSEHDWWEGPDAA